MRGRPVGGRRTGSEEDSSEAALPCVRWGWVRFLGGDHACTGSLGGMVAVGASVGWRSVTGSGVVRVRVDAAVPLDGRWSGFSREQACDVHLLVNPDAPGGARRAEYADVLVARAPLPSVAARARAEQLVARWPGCLVAAVSDRGGGCALGARGGGSVVLPAGAAVGRFPAPPFVVASVAHAWVVAGGSSGDLRSVVLEGGGE